VQDGINKQCLSLMQLCLDSMTNSDGHTSDNTVINLQVVRKVLEWLFIIKLKD